MGEVPVLVLKAVPEAVREARAFVVMALGAAGWGGCVDEARLVVSELVTNGVVHGSGPGDPVVVRVLVEGGGACVEVWDRGDDVGLRAKGENFAAVDGRGLRLVEDLTARWGVRPLAEGGKVVFAELRPDP